MGLLKSYLIETLIALFLFLALTEQVLNGLFGTHFVIKDLIDIFTWIFGQSSIKYFIDSWLNSHPNVKP